MKYGLVLNLDYARFGSEMWSEFRLKIRKTTKSEIQMDYGVE